jgi:hypothetical protein
MIPTWELRSRISDWLMQIASIHTDSGHALNFVRQLFSSFEDEKEDGGESIWEERICQRVKNRLGVMEKEILFTRMVLAGVGRPQT